MAGTEFKRARSSPERESRRSERLASASKRSKRPRFEESSGQLEGRSRLVVAMDEGSGGDGEPAGPNGAGKGDGSSSSENLGDEAGGVEELCGQCSKIFDTDKLGRPVKFDQETSSGKPRKVCTACHYRAVGEPEVAKAPSPGRRRSSRQRQHAMHCERCEGPFGVTSRGEVERLAHRRGRRTMEVCLACDQILRAGSAQADGPPSPPAVSHPVLNGHLDQGTSGAPAGPTALSGPSATHCQHCSGPFSMNLRANCPLRYNHELESGAVIKVCGSCYQYNRKYGHLKGRNVAPRGRSSPQRAPPVPVAEGKSEQLPTHCQHCHGHFTADSRGGPHRLNHVMSNGKMIKICMTCYNYKRSHDGRLSEKYRAPDNSGATRCQNCKGEFSVNIRGDVCRYNHRVGRTSIKICGSCYHYKRRYDRMRSPEVDHDASNTRKNGPPTRCEHCQGPFRMLSRGEVQRLNHETSSGRRIKICMSCYNRRRLQGNLSDDEEPRGEKARSVREKMNSTRSSERCGHCQKPFQSNNRGLVRYNHTSTNGDEFKICGRCYRHRNTQRGELPPVGSYSDESNSEDFSEHRYPSRRGPVRILGDSLGGDGMDGADDAPLANGLLAGLLNEDGMPGMAAGHGGVTVNITNDIYKPIARMHLEKELAGLNNALAQYRSVYGESSVSLRKSRSLPGHYVVQYEE